MVKAGSEEWHWASMPSPDGPPPIMWAAPSCASRAPLVGFLQRLRYVHMKSLAVGDWTQSPARNWGRNANIIQYSLPPASRVCPCPQTASLPSHPATFPSAPEPTPPVFCLGSPSYLPIRDVLLSQEPCSNHLLQAACPCQTLSVSCLWPGRGAPVYFGRPYTGAP